MERKYMMELNNLIKIPGGKLTGFLWRSNSDPHTVKVFDGGQDAPEIKLDASENPFVVEGQLYDIGTNKSYSIKYVDGLYSLKVYDVEKLDKEIRDIQEYRYIASFDEAPGRLCFREYWREEEKEDTLCLDFKPLCPAEFVFVGFKK